MPLHVSGLSTLTGTTQGLGAQTGLGIAGATVGIGLLCNDWAKVAASTYAIRGNAGEFRRLISHSPVRVVGTGLQAFIYLKRDTNPLSTFQFVSESVVKGGASKRVIGKRTLKEGLRGGRSPSAKVRALRTSQFKLVVDKRTNTKGFWYAAKGSLFARDQQATWAGGQRLPIHRMLAIPLASYMNSERVRARLGLVNRIALLGGTIRRIT